MKAIKSEVDAPKLPVNVQPCPSSGIETAEFARMTWFHKAALGVPFEAVLESKYWNHVANKTELWSKIEVVSLDGTWEAELRIVDKGDNWIMVRPINYVRHEYSIIEEVIPEGYRIDHFGPELRYCSVRSKDGSRVTEGARSRGQAVSALNKHIRDIAA